MKKIKMSRGMLVKNN